MKSVEKFISILLFIFIATMMLCATEKASAQPTEVWVDDDYCNRCPNDGHTWGSDAFDKIQDGIDTVASPGTVYVTAGSYVENLTLKGGLNILGAGAQSTTIDGGGADSVVTAIDIGSETVLDGFTITNGTGTTHGSYYTYGGGFYISNSLITIRNNVITANHGSDGAGGIEAYDSVIGIYNNNISENSGWWGGAITLHRSGAEIANNIINKNDCGYGGAIFVTDSSQATIINNQVTLTSIGMGLSPGIGIGESSTAVIINNTIANNLGNGIATGTYSVRGGMGSAIITNCILWGNNDDLANLAATYSNIEDADLGEGNISEYPMFVNLAAGDYHLKPTSPCIDAGTNDGAPTNDLNGDSRPYDGDGDGVAIVDMGADEVWPLLSHDIALQAILAPPADIEVGVTVTPIARFQNVGVGPESEFPVTCQIELSGEQVYLDSQTVLSLSSMESIDLAFGSWTPQERGYYELWCHAQLFGDENSDNDTQTSTIHVRSFPNPDADLTSDTTEGALPLRVQFTDLSIGIITEWLWDFGDGYISTEQNPIHTYDSEGTYTVSLTVSNPDGSNTETKTDYITVVNVPPGWSLPEKLTDWIGHPDIASDDSGNVFIVSEYYMGGIYFMTKPAAGTWSIPEKISDSIYEARIAVDHTGALHALWQESYEILYSSRESDGSWSSPVQISTNFGSKWSPAIVVDSKNTVHVVWVWQAGWGIFYTQKPEGGEWSTPVSISGPPTPFSSSNQPYIEVDSEGRVGVIWVQTDPTRILYASMATSGSWSEPVTISTEIPGYPLNGSPQIAAGSDGTIHAVWNQNGVFYSSLPLGGEWSVPILIPTTGLSGANSPNIVIDNNRGIVYVSWIGFGFSSIEVVYAYSYIGSTSWSSERLFPAASVSDASVSMAIDNKGNLHLAWFRTDIYNYGILYSEFVPIKKIPAKADIDPDTLNLKSKGKWVTAYIELADEYNVTDINVDTVMLDTIPADWGEVQGNFLMVKFDRQILIDYLSAIDQSSKEVTLTMSGELIDGSLFEGSDTILIFNGKK